MSDNNSLIIKNGSCYIEGKLVKQHLDCGQNIGVGYPRSKNNLFREINRGVEWIFCNDAVGLSNILRAELKKAQSLVVKRRDN